MKNSGHLQLCDHSNLKPVTLPHLLCLPVAMVGYQAFQLTSSTFCSLPLSLSCFPLSHPTFWQFERLNSSCLSPLQVSLSLWLYAEHFFIFFKRAQDCWAHLEEEDNQALWKTGSSALFALMLEHSTIKKSSSPESFNTCSSSSIYQDSKCTAWWLWS